MTGDEGDEKRDARFSGPRLEGPEGEGPAWDRLAGRYNDPPEVPREEIWSGIRKELDGAGAFRADSGSQERRSTVPRHVLGWAAAAALVLLMGVGIGRQLGNGEPGESTGAPNESTGMPVATEVDGDARRVGLTDGAEEAGQTDEMEEDIPDANGIDGAIMASSEPMPTVVAGGQSLQMAATDFLSASETFLAMVRSDARQGRLEPEIGGWARSLLTETRLLMDSQASADPELALLLGELELTLIQVVQAARTQETDTGRSSREMELLTTRLESSNMAPRIEAMTPMLTNGDGS